MSRLPKLPQRGKRDVKWGDGTFSGGGGGSVGGGGASGNGYWMNAEELRAFHEQHPNLQPHMAQPGETVDRIAADHGVKVADLRVVNGLAPGATIKPGQILALPAGSLQRVQKNGYAFGLDAANRTHKVEGDLYLANDPKRSRTSQRQAGGTDRLAADDGGHFIAARFGGPTDAFNHFAQDANFNRGGYRAVEDGWAKDFRAGRHVSVDIVAHYSGSSRRPDSIRVRSIIDGHSRVRTFENKPKGYSHGR